MVSQNLFECLPKLFLEVNLCIIQVDYTTMIAYYSGESIILHQQLHQCMMVDMKLTLTSCNQQTSASVGAARRSL